MRHIFLFILIFALAACKGNKSEIEFDGTATGIEMGTVVIKDQNTNEPIYTANIEEDKFHIGKQRLPQKGFYDLVILAGAKPHKFEIYLEPGSYHIKLDKDNLADYPEVTTEAPGMQNDLTNYTRMSEKATAHLRKEARDLNAKVKSDAVQADSEEYEEIAKRLRAIRNEIEEVNINTLEAFVTKYPNNIAAAHVTAKMPYTDEPERFLKIYNKFSEADKKSDVGQSINDKLNGILNISKQTHAEPLQGTTPDGKTVDLKKLGAKLILVEFWRSDSELSRSQHEALVLNPLPGYKEKDLAIVSVSMDTKRDRWLDGIKAGKMDWIQVSDLKGNSSPNAYKWGITTLPSFYLIDSEGKIIQRDLPFKNLTISIASYLEKH